MPQYYDANGNPISTDYSGSYATALNGASQLAGSVDPGSLGSTVGKDALTGASLGLSVGTPFGGVGGVIGAGVGAVAGAGLGLYSGLHQKAQAKKLLQQTPYPTQPIPQGIEQNATEAGRLALQGLPSAQYQQAMNNIQRQQENAIIASQGQRAGMGTIGNIQQGGQDALLGLSAQDQAQRIKNIENAQQQNQVLGQYTNQSFDWNQRNRYLQNYQYAMSLMGAGNQNIVRGIDAGASGLARIGYLGGFNGLFGNGKSSYPPTLPSSVNVNYGYADANANASTNGY
jgi:hypothetical protein